MLNMESKRLALAHFCFEVAREVSTTARIGGEAPQPITKDVKFCKFLVKFKFCSENEAARQIQIDDDSDDEFPEIPNQKDFKVRGSRKRWVLVAVLMLVLSFGSYFLGTRFDPVCLEGSIQHSCSNNIQDF